MRVDVTGTLHRYRTRKYPRGGGLLDRVFASLLMESLHKDGKLDPKYYYPEWACVSVAKGEAGEPFWPSQNITFKFGKHGTACKRHWQAIRDKTRVRLVADVEPYQNRLGASVKRVSVLEPAAMDAEAEEHDDD